MTSSVVQALAKSHDGSSFACDVSLLDDFLRTRAGQVARRYVAAVFVMVATNDGKAIRGHYALSSFGIEQHGLPAAFTPTSTSSASPTNGHASFCRWQPSASCSRTTDRAG